MNILKSVVSMISKITGIIKNHFELLSYVVTGKGNPSTELMKKFNVKQPDLVSTAYKVGKSKITDSPVTKKQSGFLDKIQQKAQSFFTSLCQKVVTGVQSTILKDTVTSDRLNQKPDWKTRINNIIDKDQIKSSLQRIVNTEVWDAKVQGETDGILESKGKDTDVSIVPFSDACLRCKELYLNKDGTPKVFKLSTLMSGSDVPLPPCHPHCRCTVKMIGSD